MFELLIDYFFDSDFNNNWNNLIYLVEVKWLDIKIILISNVVEIKN